jgi:hypothetical protein
LAGLLYVNELPLRHIITTLDGRTVFGSRFSGPLGRQIEQEDLHASDPDEFEPIVISVVRPSAEILNDQSNHQRLLLEYMLGVSCGTVAAKFIHRKPGPLNHARWLIAAIRRTVEPSDTVILLAKDIQAVYGKV